MEKDHPLLYMATGLLFSGIERQGESCKILPQQEGQVRRYGKKSAQLSTWSSPLIIEYGGLVQVIASGNSKVRSYNLENGNTIWKCSGLTSNVTPNPVYHNNLLYVMSGYRGNALMAINMAAAKGDITGNRSHYLVYRRQYFICTLTLANKQQDLFP